jgi:hypothetical protein
MTDAVAALMIADSSARFVHIFTSGKICVEENAELRCGKSTVDRLCRRLDDVAFE